MFCVIIVDVNGLASSLIQKEVSVNAFVPDSKNKDRMNTITTLTMSLAILQNTNIDVSQLNESFEEKKAVKVQKYSKSYEKNRKHKETMEKCCRNKNFEKHLKNIVNK